MAYSHDGREKKLVDLFKEFLESVMTLIAFPIPQIGLR